MREIFKIVIKKFVKNFVVITNTNRIGRYITEYLAKYIPVMLLNKCDKISNDVLSKIN